MIIPRDAIQTYTHYFDYANLNPDDVKIEDIAHSLSLLCRFGGHINQFYSVAAHCCMVHDMMEEDGLFAHALSGLLHDAHEAYVSDVTRPLKRFLKEAYGFDFNKVVSDPIDEVIFKKFGIQFPHSHYIEDQIKKYDNIALFTENVNLFSDVVEWDWYVEPRSKEFFANYIDPTKDWEQEFLERFNRYQEKS